MKTIKWLITACIAIFALSSAAFALPPEKTGAPLPTLTKKSQFEALKGGDKVVLVCKMCDTVNVFDIRDTKHAMALCKEGRLIHCEVCKKKYKVTWTPRQIRRTNQEIDYRRRKGQTLHVPRQAELKAQPTDDWHGSSPRSDDKRRHYCQCDESVDNQNLSPRITGARESRRVLAGRMEGSYP